MAVIKKVKITELSEKLISLIKYCCKTHEWLHIKYMKKIIL